MDRDGEHVSEHGRAGGKESRGGGLKKRPAATDSIQAGLCGLQLREVMDTRISTAVPVMLQR